MMNKKIITKIMIITKIIINLYHLMINQKKFYLMINLVSHRMLVIMIQIIHKIMDHQIFKIQHKIIILIHLNRMIMNLLKTTVLLKIILIHHRLLKILMHHKIMFHLLMVLMINNNKISQILFY